MKVCAAFRECMSCIQNALVRHVSWNLFVIIDPPYVPAPVATILYTVPGTSYSVEPTLSWLESYLKGLDRRIITTQGVLCCAKTAERLGPFWCKFHAPLGVLQGLAFGISKLEVCRATVAVVDLQFMIKHTQGRGSLFDRSGKTAPIR